MTSQLIKSKVLESVQSGMPVAQAAKQFKVSQASIHNWKAKAKNPTKVKTIKKTRTRALRNSESPTLNELRIENTHLKVFIAEMIVRSLQA